MGLLFSQTSEFQLQPPSSIQEPLSVCYSSSNSFSLPSGPLYQLHPSSLSVEEKKQIPGGETATLPLSYPAERTEPFLAFLGPSSSPSPQVPASLLREPTFQLRTGALLMPRRAALPRVPGSVQHRRDSTDTKDENAFLFLLFAVF